MNQREGITVCAGCGCTDLQACPGGCSWLAADHQAGTGICSRCPSAMTAWRNQRAEVGQASRDNKTRELVSIGPTDI
jgi:hypothetical protein